MSICVCRRNKKRKKTIETALKEDKKMTEVSRRGEIKVEINTTVELERFINAQHAWEKRKKKSKEWNWKYPTTLLFKYKMTAKEKVKKKKEKTWHFDSTWLSLVSLFSHRSSTRKRKEKKEKTPPRLGLVFFDGVLESSVCLELLSTRRELVRMRMNKRGGWNENRDNIYIYRENAAGRC